MIASISSEKFNSIWKLCNPALTPIVTTRSQDGIVNAAMVSWFSFVSVVPPLLMVSIRHAPKKRQRHTYGIIKETKEFVINIPGYNIYENAFITSIDFSWEEEVQANKLVRAGLTELPGEKVKAPRIKECKIHFECVLEWEKEVGDHTMFIGRVVAASAEEGTFDDKLWPNINVIKPILRCGGVRVVDKIGSGHDDAIVDFSKDLPIKWFKISQQVK